jgi:hypothetical protein
MKDEKLKKGIDEIKMIKMTDAEKEHIFENIINYSAEIKKPIKSPWSFYFFVRFINKNKLVYYIIIPLILIISGGGVVFAAQESLPNSILYPIKTNIIEPVEGALILSQKEKAKHESNLAKKRLVEAEILAEQGKLNVVAENKIKNLISEHTISLNNALDKVDLSNSKEEVDDITTNFRAEMNAHAKILNNIIKRSSYKRDENNNQDNKVTNVDVVSKSDIFVSTPISEIAQSSAEKVKINSKNQKVKNKDNFKNKQKEVRLLIDNTDKIIGNDLNTEAKTEDKTTNETHKTIDEAKKYLEDADRMSTEGNIIDAYSSLLDSESSAKEADIVIKNEDHGDKKGED